MVWSVVCAGGTRFFMKYSFSILILLGTVAHPNLVLAKIPFEQLGGVDWISYEDAAQWLNPINGVVFTESGLLRGLGEIDHDYEPLRTISPEN